MQMAARSSFFIKFLQLVVNQGTKRGGYRLFSSAVFGDQFQEWTEPEIKKVPLEGGSKASHLA